ncbi:EF-P lysine aminoacylase GenX [Marinomonas agarivorans]|nr:EF-P lysine aminoacylase GenX [Marinomonas agarivorans]
MYDPNNWRSSIGQTRLQKRAILLRRIREFFWQQGVMEVDTQLLSLASISDPHIEVLTTRAKCQGQEQTYYLQTSPEFAMKRLLCSGSGDIYQLGKVFRAEEQSRRHGIEFTMLEWYRLGLDQWQLMAEIEALLVYICAGVFAGADVSNVDVSKNVSKNSALRCEYKSYAEAFQTYVGINPFTATLANLQQLAHKQTGFGLSESNRDTLLELLFSTLIEPKIGLVQPCFIHSYPASQGAFAKVNAYTQADDHTQTDSRDQPTAARFELYWRGMELANGYDELTDAAEQAKRMTQETQLRENAAKLARQTDHRLVAALEAGLPACSGVALGVDRLLMVLTDSQHIDEVVPFGADQV